MPSTFSPLLRAELQASGENDTTWGDKTNANLSTVLENAIAGLSTITLVDANYTLSVGFGSDDEARKAILVIAGVLTANRNITVPSTSKMYTVRNNTTGGFAVTIKTAAGTGVSVVNGTTQIVFCDGTNVLAAQSPTSDNSITPQKIDPTSTYAWQFNAALGVNRNQPFVPNYGVIGMDGTDGSFISLYQGGTQIGTMSATSSAFDFSSPGKPITFTTNTLTRLTINNNGNITATGAFSAASLTAAGAVNGASLTIGGTGNFTGVVTATGYVGITASNVANALQYTPIQQGTGSFQAATQAVKIGWSTTHQRLRAQVESTDLGNIVFDTTSGVFVPMAGAIGPITFATNTFSTVPGSAPIIIRERGYGGAQGGGGDGMAPKIGFIHSGKQDGALLWIATDNAFSLRDGTGTGGAGLFGSYASFSGAVTQGTSDDRLKDKRGAILGARNMLRRLSSFYYSHNKTARDLGLNDPSTQIGWSAQEVKRVLPELIAPAPIDREGVGYMTIRYERAVPILSAAINEMDEVIEKQGLQIQRLQDTVTVLMNRLAALEGNNT